MSESSFEGVSFLREGGSGQGWPLVFEDTKHHRDVPSVGRSRYRFALSAFKCAAGNYSAAETG